MCQSRRTHDSGSQVRSKPLWDRRRCRATLRRLQLRRASEPAGTLQGFLCLVRPTMASAAIEVTAAPTARWRSTPETNSTVSAVDAFRSSGRSTLPRVALRSHVWSFRLRDHHDQERRERRVGQRGLGWEARKAQQAPAQSDDQTSSERAPRRLESGEGKSPPAELLAHRRDENVVLRLPPGKVDHVGHVASAAR